MKTHIGIWMIASLLFFTSCNEWLDVRQEGEFEAEDLYANGEGYRAVINKLYKMMAESSLYGENLTYGVVDCMSQQYALTEESNANSVYRSFTDFKYTDNGVPDQIDAMWLNGYRMIANANDLLQNTFMKAWINLAYFRGDAKISTWLFKIAINECITFLNRQRTMNNISINDTDVFLLERLKGDDYFDGDEIQLKLQEAMLTLPQKQRLVFQMKYFQEMKYDEMSEILGTSVGALKASYHHAVKKVEDFLTKDV